MLSVPDSSSGVIRHRRDVVTVQSPTLGPIEFPSGIFRDSFYGQTLKIRVIKIPKTCSTGASWRFDEFVCDDICSDEVSRLLSKFVSANLFYSEVPAYSSYKRAMER